MPVSRTEAERALGDLDRTQARAQEWMYGQHSAPHLFLWGTIWLIGYGASAWRPDWAVVWPWLIGAGSLGSCLVGVVMGRRNPNGGGWSYAIAAALIATFVVGVMLVLQPVTQTQFSAFAPLVVGLIYGLMGLAPGARRMLVLGIVITALTLIGYFLLQPSFMAWMAVVGGGGLILGGFWIRKV